MKCPKCGILVEDTAYDCRGCGVIFEKLRQIQEKKTQAPPVTEKAPLFKRWMVFMSTLNPWTVRAASGGIVALFLFAFALYYRFSLHRR